MPLLSVLIPCHNSARFIRQTVQSVLDQTLDPSRFEILAIDDCSTDETPELLAAFGSRLRVVRTPRNLGRGTAALRYGLGEARGDVVLPLDHDDLFAPVKLERIAARFEARPKLGYLLHAYRKITEGGRDLGPDPRLAGLTQENLRSRMLSGAVLYTGSSYAVRREIFERIPGTGLDRLGAHDMMVAILAALDDRSDLEFIPEVLSAWRLHPEMISGALCEHGIRDRTWSIRGLRTLQWIASRYPSWVSTPEASVARIQSWRNRQRAAALTGEAAMMGALLPPLVLACLCGRLSARACLISMAQVALTFLFGVGWVRFYRRWQHQWALRPIQPGQRSNSGA